MQKLRPFSLVKSLTTGLATVAEKPSHLFVRLSPRPMVVEPNLDFEDRLKEENKDKLQALLRKRGRVDVDLESMRFRYMQWKELTKRYEKLDREHVTLQQEAALEKRRELSDRQKSVLNDLKRLQEELRGIQSVIPDCLRLPNDLLDETPIDKSRIVEEYKKDHVKDHVMLLKNSMETRSNPPQLFLKGSTAMLQLAVEDYFCQNFSQHQFERLSAPHMVRPAVVEGCGLDPHSKQRVIQITDDPDADPGISPILNLTGSTLSSLIAVFTRKMLSNSNQFPLRLFASGTNYRANVIHKGTFPKHGLYSAPQYPAVSALALARTHDEAKTVYGSMKIVLGHLMRELDIPHTLHQIASQKLEQAEMARISFRTGTDEEDSPELASVSYYGTYLSERLRITIGDQKKATYAVCAFATVDIYSVLASIVEQYWNDSSSSIDVPSCLKYKI